MPTKIQKRRAMKRKYYLINKEKKLSCCQTGDFKEEIIDAVKMEQSSFQSNFSDDPTMLTNDCPSEDYYLQSAIEIVKDENIDNFKLESVDMPYQSNQMVIKQEFSSLNDNQKSLMEVMKEENIEEQKPEPYHNLVFPGDLNVTHNNEQSILKCYDESGLTIKKELDPVNEFNTGIQFNNTHNLNGNMLTKIGYLCTKNKTLFLQKPILVCNPKLVHQSKTKNHIGQKTYKCDVCLKTLRRKSSLTKHATIHTGEKPFQCNVCQITFRYKSSLTKHATIHTGEKPFKCNICQIAFRYKSTLTKHATIHTGEKPFKCNICQKAFRQKCILSRHLITHTEEKMFKCNVCHKGFKRKCSIITHATIHTGEMPFNCNVCQKAFRTKSALAHHAKTCTK